MSETKENTNSEWRERELGALWVRQGKGQKYLTGHVEIETMPGVTEKVKVVVFSNKGKTENERAPDYVMYRSVSPEATASTATDQASIESTEKASEELPAALV
ncbi:MAG: hypothetical protein CMO74_14140 [Verrucomicrobiales bacterium]|nr:hypothetical protein [Verrucomicrobiales bacterium]|tara:strand:+ start:38960 stop:39268 length:309 start_codon:yes stop_codon:yes gene_type:complete